MDVGDLLSFMGHSRGLGHAVYGFDYTYLLVLLGVLISMISRSIINGAYKKYSAIRSRRGMTGRDTAQMIMSQTGIYGVSINMTDKKLGDNYNPNEKSVNLSTEVHDGTSIASIAVAAHECGHMMQDNEGYAPLRIRHTMVPLTNICSTLSMPVIILGLILGIANLIHIGILLFTVALVFQLVTLPVEFDASRRALRMINALQILDEDEKKGAKKVLTAAAFTYVSAVIVTALNILRFVLLAKRR